MQATETTLRQLITLDPEAMVAQQRLARLKAEQARLGYVPYIYTYVCIYIYIYMAELMRHEQAVVAQQRLARLKAEQARLGYVPYIYIYICIYIYIYMCVCVCVYTKETTLRHLITLDPEAMVAQQRLARLKAEQVLTLDRLRILTL